MNSRLKKTMIISILIVVVLFVIVIIIGMVNNKNLSYEEVEIKMKEAAYEYYVAHPTELPQNESSEIKINVDTLIEKNYMKSTNEYLKGEKQCDGEVSVELRNGEYIYTPYLNCENYSTESLYNYITKREQIIENKNSGEDGLYNYGDKLIYRGENVNNYVLFANKLWRILRIDEKNNIRMIQDEELGEAIWDNRYNADVKKSVGYNRFEKSRLQETFEKIYNGNVGEVFSTVDKKYLISDYLCLDGKSELSFNQNGIIECNTKSQDKYPFTFIDISEYFIASTDPNCNSFNNNSCNNYNYLNYYGAYWSMNMYSKNSYQSYYVSRGVYADDVNEEYGVRLVITLSKNSLYSVGDGTKENPYKIK